MRQLHPLVHSFCSRRHLVKKHVIEIRANKHREYVYLEDPLLLARLAGHLKHNLGQPATGFQVFMRGQSKDHKGMFPSIFRRLDWTSNEFHKRLSAFDDLISEIRNIRNLKRFQGDMGGALLQHYGIRTPWLDVVDNIFIALWFASRNQSKKEPYSYTPKEEGEVGWLYFLQVEEPLNQKSLLQNMGIVNGKKTLWCDLRCYQTSLSLRAHTQHGIFCSLNNKNRSNIDLDEIVVASVQYKITIKMLSFIDEFIPFSMSYMFPNQTYDNTFKYLRQSKVTDLINEIESRHSLANREMGRVYLYR